MQIKLLINETEVHGELYDHPVAQQLVNLLPLQLVFDDFSRGVVLYYGSPGKWPGLVRMGRFDYSLDSLRELHDGARIHIAVA